MPDLISLRLGHDLRQSAGFGKFMQSLGWQVHQLKDASGSVNIYQKSIGPLHFAKIRRSPANTPWRSVHKFLRLHKILILQADLESGDMPSSYHLKKEQVLGTKTLLIDLRPSSEQIMSTFKPETRLKLRKLLKENHQETKNNFTTLYTILKTGLSDIDVWCPPQNQFQSLYESFGSDAFSITIDDSAGCLVLINGPVAEYYYAASTKVGKSQNLPYLVAWLAMLEAKKRGAMVWDFNGLIDPRWPDKRWAGFSFFKTRFGGTELTFPGTCVKYGWW